MKLRSPFGALALLAAGAAALCAQEEPPRRRVFPVPILGYTPETSVMLGAALVGVASVGGSDTATRPTTALATAVLTFKSQYSATIAVDRWTAGDRWHLAGETGVSQFPAEFHGIGSAATDSSETYTPRTFYLTAAVQRRLTGQFFIGGGYAIRHATMVETEPGGRLEAGTIPGSRGGTEAVLTVDGVWDTRSTLYMTRRGGYLRMAYGISDRFVGADHAYRRLTADARAYRAAGTMVVAAQAVVDAVDGTAPFELLPRLGGQNILRGFTEPRFRDGATAAAQAELRAPIRGVVGLVIFGGAGATAPALGDLPDGKLRATGGLGLRLVLDRAEGLQLRVDYAFARGGGGLYIAAGDAF